MARTPTSATEKLSNFKQMNGAPEEIRTPDPQIRSLVLYPAELRARNGPYITALACRSFDPAANVRCYLAIDGSKSKLPEPKTFAAKKHVHIRNQTRRQPGYAMADAAVQCMSPELSLVSDHDMHQIRSPAAEPHPARRL